MRAGKKKKSASLFLFPFFLFFSRRRGGSLAKKKKAKTRFGQGSVAGGGYERVERRRAGWE